MSLEIVKKIAGLFQTPSAPPVRRVNGLQNFFRYTLQREFELPRQIGKPLHDLSGNMIDGDFVRRVLCDTALVNNFHPQKPRMSFNAPVPGVLGRLI